MRGTLVLSIPLFFELFMQLMVGNVSQFTLSPLGQEVVTAVGNALQILNIVTIVLSAMGAASTVLITRSLGSKQSLRSISQIAIAAVLINIALAGVITAIVFVGWPHFFTLLNIDKNIWSYAAPFLLIVSSSTVFQGILFVLTAFLRSYTKVVDVLLVSFVMNIVNVGLCVLMTYGGDSVFQLSVESVAWVTIITRLIGVILAGAFVFYHTPLRMRASLFHPFPGSAFKEILRIGVPSSGEQLNYDLAQVVILSFINILGTTAVMAKVCCSMIAGIVYLYSLALSQATQVTVGYLFGAGKFNLIPQRIWAVDFLAVCLTLGFSVLFWVNSETILGLLTQDSKVQSLGRQILFIEIFLSVGRALNIVMVKALITLGETKIPVAVNMVSSWSVAVVGGYIFGFHFGWSLIGIWIAICLDEWIRAVFLIGVFARGRWRKKALLTQNPSSSSSSLVKSKTYKPIVSKTISSAVLGMTDEGETPKTILEFINGVLLSLF